MGCDWLTLTSVANREGSQLPQLLVVAGATLIAALATCIVLTHTVQLLRGRERERAELEIGRGNVHYTLTHTHTHTHLHKERERGL